MSELRDRVALAIRECVLDSTGVIKTDGIRVVGIENTAAAAMAVVADWLDEGATAQRRLAKECFGRGDWWAGGQQEICAAGLERAALSLLREARA